MSIAIPTTITGAAQTGFTSPTYTTVADKSPDPASNQYVVTAVGGTQTGARIHSVSDPFLFGVTKPKSMKALPSPNPVTGKYPPLPSNRYAIQVHKGVNFAANNAPAVAHARLYVDVPVGSDAYDPANLRAMLSALIGAVSTLSAGIGDTAANGVI